LKTSTSTGTSEAVHPERSEAASAAERSRRTRLLAIGLASGLLASLALFPALGAARALVIGALTGLVFPFLFRADRAASDSLMAGASLGVPLWALFPVVVLPLLDGDAPRWTAGEMRALLPALVAFVLFGAALGMLARLLATAADRALGPAPAPAPAPLPAPRRVVILGGGFAGVTCAQELERLLGADKSVQLTLVSDVNALLFTPMLAEVAGSRSSRRTSRPRSARASAAPR
jgi:NADH dehydrogenase